MRYGACRRGFTLVELIVALAILVVLAVFGLQRFAAAQKQAQQNAQWAQAQALAQAVSAFYAVNGCYPPSPGDNQMPAGLAPYVGGTWPMGYQYVAWSCTSYCVNASSGGTANGIGVIADALYQGIFLSSDMVVLVYYQPVPVC